MKKNTVQTGIILLLTAALAAVWLLPLLHAHSKPAGRTLRVGIAAYQMNDQYISDYIGKLEADLDRLGSSMGVRLLYQVMDAAGSKTRQNGQLDYMVSQDFDVLAVNLVDTTSASRVINKAKAAGLPVIFFNRQPAQEDLALWDGCYYVGADGAASGQMQAEILLRAYGCSPREVDANGDGTLSYILVEGEQTHSDSIKRTDAFIRRVGEQIPARQLAVLSANWMRGAAREAIGTLPPETVSQAEVVVCNNDDMALGVLDFLRASGRAHRPLIVGANGAEEVLREIEAGNILGTVSLQTPEQVEQIDGIVKRLYEGNPPAQKVYLTEQSIIP